MIKDHICLEDYIRGGGLLLCISLQCTVGEEGAGVYSAFTMQPAGIHHAC